MVIVKKETIENIPLLHVVKQSLLEQKLPLVIFIHGFESTKERNIQYAYMLAEKGYRVILPDVLYHGERTEDQNLHLQFWNIVITTIHELNILKETFESKGLIEENRIGLAGTSMGAIITLGTMAKYDWVHTAVSLMGNPAYVDFAKMQIKSLEQSHRPLPLTEEQMNEQLNKLREYDATSYLREWNTRPLLFWHGKCDVVVPHLSAYQFYEQLKRPYEEKGVPLSFILDEKAGHVVPNKGVDETVNWFIAHL